MRFKIGLVFILNARLRLCDVVAYSIKRAIVLHAHFVNGGNGYEGDLSDAFEDALDLYGVNRPTQLFDIAKGDEGITPELQYFFQHISSIRRLEDSTAFATYDEVEHERITEFDESFRLASAEFSNFIWTIVRFQHADNSWAAKLLDTLAVVAEHVTPPYVSDGHTFKTDIAIVTALLAPELAAVLELPVTWEQVKVRHDATNYHVSRFAIGGKQLTAVATAASDKGLPGAAVAATKVIYSFRPKYLFVVGICAGLKGRAEFGDVLVADPAYDWGSGKIRKSANGEEIFHPAQYQLRLDETWRANFLDLKEDATWRTAVHANYNGIKPDNVFDIRVGPVASGASVLQNSDAVQRILGDHKDLLGVEMEIFSVMFAAHVAPAPRPVAIALKSVCDFGDEEKHDDYQKYAAYTSAQVLWKMIERMVGG